VKKKREVQDPTNDQKRRFAYLGRLVKEIRDGIIVRAVSGPNVGIDLASRVPVGGGPAEPPPVLPQPATEPAPESGLPPPPSPPDPQPEQLSLPVEPVTAIPLLVPPVIVHDKPPVVGSAMKAVVKALGGLNPQILTDLLWDYGLTPLDLIQMVHEEEVRLVREQQEALEEQRS